MQGDRAMPNVMEDKFLDLQKLASQCFGNLSAAEQELLRQTQRIARSSSKLAAVTAVAKDQQNAVNSFQVGNDVSRSRVRERKAVKARVDTEWAEERGVRADLLRWLCVDRDVREYLNDFWIELQLSQIRGRLNLTHVDIRFPIICRTCWFPDGLDLDGAVVSDIILDGSWVGPRPKSTSGEIIPASSAEASYSAEDTRSETPPVLSAQGLSAKGSVLLRGVHVEGEANLIGADIQGDLSCSGSEFINPAETALVLDRAQIHGNLHLREKFAAKGQVSMLGATIHGDLDCRSGTFEYRHRALLARGATVNGSVFLCQHERNKFVATGLASLARTRIRGDVMCAGGLFNGQFELFGADIGGHSYVPEVSFSKPTNLIGH
jgi:hypothetical protein